MIPVFLPWPGSFGYKMDMVHTSSHMANDVLLHLPHRQYVWCIPKALRIYFRNDRSDQRKSRRVKSRGHLIRYYGLYSSRSRGKARKDGSLDKFGWGARSEEEPKKEPEENPVETLSEKKSKQTWARLIKKVYEVDPLICTKCGSEMAVLVIITNPEEVHKILNHLRKNKSPTFDNKTQPETS